MLQSGPIQSNFFLPKEEEMEQIWAYRSGNMVDLRDEVNKWLKENDGKIEIVARLMSYSGDTDVTIVIFYKTKA